MRVPKSVSGAIPESMMATPISAPVVDCAVSPSVERSTLAAGAGSAAGLPLALTFELLDTDVTHERSATASTSCRWIVPITAWPDFRSVTTSPCASKLLATLARQAAEPEMMTRCVVVAVCRASCSFRSTLGDDWLAATDQLEALHREWLPVVEVDGVRAFTYFVQREALLERLGEPG